MNRHDRLGGALGRRDPIAIAALVLALAALVFSMTGGAPAQPAAPAKAGKGGNSLSFKCPKKNSVDLGTWCLDLTSQPVPASAAGQNNYLYAARTCVNAGGWLPTAAQLLGAAAKVKLQSTIDDDPTTSQAEEFPSSKKGIKDRREMSSDLFTTTAGPEAAGSEGVTEGARGSGALGEPDPTPVPAVPLPTTLDYVTVYDNHNQGGFAGGESVGTAENFRCAYAKGSAGKAPGK